MTNLTPSVELKKADGRPIKFNFQFENGLPMMPTYEVPYEIWVNPKTEKHGLKLIINSSLGINNLNFSEVSFHQNHDNSIWIHLTNCYLLLMNVEKKYIDKMEKYGLSISFVDENNNKLLGNKL